MRSNPRCTKNLARHPAQEQTIERDLRYHNADGGSFRFVQERDCCGSPAGIIVAAAFGAANDQLAAAHRALEDA